MGSASLWDLSRVPTWWPSIPDACSQSRLGCGYSHRCWHWGWVVPGGGKEDVGVHGSWGQPPTGDTSCDAAHLAGDQEGAFLRETGTCQLESRGPVHPLPAPGGGTRRHLSLWTSEPCPPRAGDSWPDRGAPQGQPLRMCLLRAGTQAVRHQAASWPEPSWHVLFQRGLRELLSAGGKSGISP